jgi:hypothetical protein
MGLGSGGRMDAGVEVRLEKPVDVAVAVVSGGFAR